LVRYDDPEMRRALDSNLPDFHRAFEEMDPGVLEVLVGMPVDYWRDRESDARFAFGVIGGVRRLPNGECWVKVNVPPSIVGEEDFDEVPHHYLRPAPEVHPRFRNYLAAILFERDLRMDSQGPEQLQDAERMVRLAWRMAREAWEAGLDGARPELAPIRSSELRSLGAWGISADA
jgi:hypothetical protein